MDAETKANLHRQLIRLGDMMGDGLHHEPDGKWISKEYRRVAQALGIIPKQKRRNNSEQINLKMTERVKSIKCSECKGALKQTKSGSMRAKCIDCGAVFQLLSRRKKKAT